MNEFCHELAFRNMSEETRRTLSPSATFGINLGSGVIAGFAAAILSQVRDSFIFHVSLTEKHALHTTAGRHTPIAD